MNILMMIASSTALKFEGVTRTTVNLHISKDMLQNVE
jgi:hypothetical protein